MAKINLGIKHENQPVTRVLNKIVIHSLNSSLNECLKWVEQFHPSEWQMKSNEQSGHNLDPIWTRRIERCLIKCMIMSN